ncbi:MAG TPA: SAM-dependent methyltransferase, partial [Streptomyces sp.]|nr:SAM-dependent methyltransferase [Streptomyces sp.]
GLDQFLDIGTGIPTEPNLHQIVQGVNPRARIVYVDNDPIVLAHARALMGGSPEGSTAYLQASITEPDSVLRSQEVTGNLDLSRPVALSVLALLHFVPDRFDAYGIIGQLVSALPSGSALVLSHGTGDFDPEVMGKVGQVYSGSVTSAQSRSREEFARFFSGLDLIDPGIEVPHRWRPDGIGGARIGSDEVRDADVALWAGLAFKP